MWIGLRQFSEDISEDLNTNDLVHHEYSNGMMRMMKRIG